MLAKTLVVELSPFNISINAIAPGATITERTTEDERLFKNMEPHYSNGQTRNS